MRNRYEVRGDATVIFLERSDGTELEALVSTSDLPKLLSMDVKWKALAKGVGKYFHGQFYAVATPRKPGGRVL